MLTRPMTAQHLSGSGKLDCLKAEKDTRPRFEIFGVFPKKFAEPGEARMGLDTADFHATASCYPARQKTRRN